MTSAEFPAPRFPEWPQYGEEERAGLTRALEQGQWWRVGGAEVSAFEREFADFHGAPYALAVTNGTHALELAVELLGIRPGEEVIVPAFTFISSSMAVQRLGAVPVPVDVLPDTYNIDPAAAAAAVTDRTRAIMPVHMAGFFSDMDALGKLATDAGVAILQDAAHAHGARWRGQRVGEFGSIAAFSFQNGKLMTAGEGGALLVPDRETYDEGFVRHSCGRPPSDRRYLHETAGTNYRMNEFSGAVLRAQLARLPEQIARREANWPILRALLAAIPGVEPQGRDDRCDVVPHYMAMFRLPGITEERRNAVVDALVARGIPAFVAFRPIYRTDAFWSAPTEPLSVDDLARRCPTTEEIGRDCVWLHHRTLLGDEAGLTAIASTLTAVLSEH
ncbi:3-amino-5-hydroxybenzoate synthase [Sphaerisporangium krabiense]|uniref:3-amino-5-hydroxybenzoate synthase n=1 Tax=Sphaerisporangium krabiense TaxID=763782 RepID=A0A7W8Z6K2_9ACTN|nr:aminotransferase class I/II-fold pyridoxal phosphate-dependent enzyme [Sphaerisporangium krabiense]MBB5628452.1 3-amino-5-hydroxybenzoate synthase [Sphaerisporangium krabiense]GII66809.1 3-amino-5-hydroxybenzoate synthase [Sphaerisporangium krabiense]